MIPVEIYESSPCSQNFVAEESNKERKVKNPLPLYAKVENSMVPKKVNLSLSFIRQGREQYGSKESEPLPCLYTPRSRTVWF